MRGPLLHDAEAMEVLRAELQRQQEKLVLIPSENYASEAVLAAQGCILTNKYAEGYPGRRYYNGCLPSDMAESLAIRRALELFKADHANVQPHSGAQANLAVYHALLKEGDTILAMNLDHGGHLTHGLKVNFSGTHYNVVFYGVDRQTELIDMNQVRDLAWRHRPRLIIVGYSAYSRRVEYGEWREIADEVGALLMADAAHIIGIIAAGLHPDPVPYCDVITATTHKTLRGPRGGMILCRQEFAKDIDRGVFPGTQGGPLMHVILAKAVAFGEALKPEFKEYQAQVLKNTRIMAETLAEKGFRIVSGTTENHLFLVDLRSTELTGREAANLLEEAGIIVNKNLIPYDERKPTETSGIRLGAPAITTRGMKDAEARRIGEWIAEVLRHPQDGARRERIRNEVRELCRSFPIYRNWATMMGMESYL